MEGPLRRAAAHQAHAKSAGDKLDDEGEQGEEAYDAREVQTLGRHWAHLQARRD